jgi:hypothetical protein
LPIRPRERLPIRPRERATLRPRERITIRTRERSPVRPRIRTPVRPRGRISPPPPITRKPPIIIRDWVNSQNSKSFDVYAKIQGMKTKYVRINYGSMRIVDALGYGKYVIDKTKLASFKIMPSQKAVTQKFSYRTGDYKFRYSVKTRNIIVEKRRYHIDSPGEKRGITALGIARLRRLRQQSGIKKFIRSLFSKPRK